MEPIKQTVENNLDSFAFQNYRMGELIAAWEQSHLLEALKLHMDFFWGQINWKFSWFMR